MYHRLVKSKARLNSRKNQPSVKSIVLVSQSRLALCGLSSSVESARNEHRGKTEGDRDDGRRNLIHGPKCRLARAKALVKPSLYILDHNDRVVHNDPDREHQPEQRE